jgi:hypothetical protein
MFNRLVDQGKTAPFYKIFFFSRAVQRNDNFWLATSRLNGAMLDRALALVLESPPPKVIGGGPGQTKTSHAAPPSRYLSSTPFLPRSLSSRGSCILIPCVLS